VTSGNSEIMSENGEKWWRKRTKRKKRGEGGRGVMKNNRHGESVSSGVK